MTEVRFYHLERSTLDQALPAILTQAYNKGMKALVKFNDQDQLAQANDTLWSFHPDSFLPHDIETTPNPAQQPILLTMADENKNDATLLVLINDTVSESLEEFELCCRIFDGQNETALKASRQEWTSLKDTGHVLKYYQQTSAGKWEEKAFHQPDQPG